MARQTMKIYPKSQSAERQSIPCQANIPLDLLALMRGLIIPLDLPDAPLEQLGVARNRVI